VFYIKVIQMYHKADRFGRRSNMFLTREQILSAEDIKTEEVEVPEWGGTVLVKGMNGKERDAFEMSFLDGSRATTENIRAKLVSLTIIDPETNKQLFTVADIDALGQKSAKALDRIFEIAQRLSKIGANDVEEMAKNS